MKLFQEYSVYLDDMTLTKEVKRINEYLANNEITFYGVIPMALNTRCGGGCFLCDRQSHRGSRRLPRSMC